jgi:phospholipid/cholesterol/gamma-HCH transport system permease protein
MVGIYAGVAGGYLVSVSNGVPAGSFVVSIRQFVEPWDFLGGLIKSLAFGSIISIVACQQGLRASNGAVGVGRATTNAVVISMVLVYIANYVLAAFLY